MSKLTKVQKERQRPVSAWIFKDAGGYGNYWVNVWWGEDYTLYVSSGNFVKTYKGITPYAFRKNVRSIKDKTLCSFFKDCYKPCHV